MTPVTQSIGRLSTKLLEVGRDSILMLCLQTSVQRWILSIIRLSKAKEELQIQDRVKVWILEGSNNLHPWLVKSFLQTVVISTKERGLDLTEDMATHLLSIESTTTWWSKGLILLEAVTRFTKSLNLGDTLLSLKWCSHQAESSLRMTTTLVTSAHRSLFPGLLKDKPLISLPKETSFQEVEFQKIQVLLHPRKFKKTRESTWIWPILKSFSKKLTFGLVVATKMVSSR